MVTLRTIRLIMQSFALWSGSVSRVMAAESGETGETGSIPAFATERFISFRLERTDNLAAYPTDLGRRTKQALEALCKLGGPSAISSSKLRRSGGLGWIDSAA